MPTRTISAPGSTSTHPRAKWFTRECRRPSSTKPRKPAASASTECHQLVKGNYHRPKFRRAMQSAASILSVVRSHRAELRRLGVRRLGLFGSAARGDASEGSDLDFLVELERKTFDAYMDVKELLEALFQRRVDLVISEAIKPQLRQCILQETIYAEG